MARSLADLQDAVAQRQVANVGYTSETGRCAGEGAGSWVPAAGQRL